MMLQRKSLGLLPWSMGMAFCLFASMGWLMAQPTLRITTPTEGVIVNAGQALTVTVEASPASAFQAVIIIGSDPIGFSQVLEHPPYKFTVPIPRQITPRREGYRITADGILAPGRGATSHPVRIIVERADIPEILISGNYSLNSGFYPSSTPAQPYHLRLSKVGFEETLYLMGMFSGREQVDLSESKYVKYSSDNLRVAEVNEIGTVHATGIGSAKITVSYRSKSVRVPVTVGGEP
jgi:hypothetical protein